jgi:hypothetical protein
MAFFHHLSRIKKNVVMFQMLNFKRRNNGKNSNKNNIKEKWSRIDKKTAQKLRHLHVRSMRCGLLQYDGIYTLRNIPLNK